MPSHALIHLAFLNKLFPAFILMCPVIANAQTLQFSYNFEHPNEGYKLFHRNECRDDMFHMRTDNPFDGQYLRTKHDGDQCCKEGDGKCKHRSFFSFQHQDRKPNNVWFENKKHNWMGVAVKWSPGPGGNGNHHRLSTVEPSLCGIAHESMIMLIQKDNKLEIRVNWREGGTGKEQLKIVEEGWRYKPNKWYRMVVYYYPTWKSDGRVIVWMNDTKIVDHRGPNASDWATICKRRGHPELKGVTVRLGLYGNRPGEVNTADWDNFQLAFGGAPDAGINSAGYQMVYPRGTGGPSTPPTAPSGVKAVIK